LVQRLEGGVTDYFIDNIPGDNTGCGLFRYRPTEERTEPGARRMGQPTSPSSRTGDARVASMLKQREVKQKLTLHAIASANRRFWNEPENQGRS
jgi:hypothetical protein